MKKAKVMLTAIALFAIVGGALAIKANRATDRVYTTNAAGLCIVTVPAATTQPGKAFITTTSVSTVFGGPCILQPYYVGI